MLHRRISFYTYRKRESFKIYFDPSRRSAHHCLCTNDSFAHSLALFFLCSTVSPKKRNLNHMNRQKRIGEYFCLLHTHKDFVVKRARLLYGEAILWIVVCFQCACACCSNVIVCFRFLFYVVRFVANCFGFSFTLISGQQALLLDIWEHFFWMYTLFFSCLFSALYVYGYEYVCVCISICRMTLTVVLTRANIITGFSLRILCIHI